MTKLFLLLVFGYSSTLASPSQTNSPPAFTSPVPAPFVHPDQPFLHEVTATDPETDPVSLYLVQPEQKDAASETGYYWATGYLSVIWQSFTAESTGFLTRAGLQSAGNYPTGSQVISIYAGTGTGGALLYQKTQNFGAILDYHTVTIPDSVKILVEAGQVYTLAITNATGYLIYDYNTNPYPGGQSSFSASADFQFVTYIKPLGTATGYTWLSFTDSGNGTGVLGGTPQTSDIGKVDLTLVALAAGSYDLQTVGFTVAPEATPPTLFGASGGNGSAFLIWNQVDSDYFSRYYLYSGTPEDPGTLTDSTTTWSDTSLTVSGLTNGTHYYFRLKVKDTWGQESGFSPVEIVTPADGFGSAVSLPGEVFGEASSAGLPVGSAPRTLEAWFKTSEGISSSQVIANYGNLGTGQRFGLLLLGGNVYFVGEYVDINTFVSANDGNWHHAAATYDGETVKVYLDGNLIGSGNLSLSTGSGAFRIGRRVAGDSYSEDFSGEIDEVRVWSEVRSQSQIQDYRNFPVNWYEPSLVANYRFDDELTDVFLDSSPSNRDGYFLGTPGFVSSSGISLSLPVELISFSGTVSMGKVHLVWSTASEKNNFGWEIEKTTERNQQAGDSPSAPLSDRNSHWEKIGFVAGSGTTSETKSYSFELPVSGPVSIRLKQSDLDGTVSYSQILTFDDNLTDFRLLGNYPNPFNPETAVRFILPAPARVSLQIYDLTGRLAGSQESQVQNPGISELKVDASALSSGTYFYRLSAGSKILTGKFTVLK
ncbi:MAG: T9SS type A sorting domain-containing protein [Bacteroidetes bacterium]|nr:T9SS type A sorting domain-containing protein [Bacteroidota bacterium]